MTKLDHVAQEALALSAEDKVKLAEELLASLDSPEQREIDAAWAAEAERRIAEYEAGRSKAVNADEVFRELRKRGT